MISSAGLAAGAFKAATGIGGTGGGEGVSGGERAGVRRSIKRISSDIRDSGGIRGDLVYLRADGLCDKSHDKDKIRT